MLWTLLPQDIILYKTYKEDPKVAQLSALTIFSPIGTGYFSTSMQQYPKLQTDLKVIKNVRYLWA